jgi:hypothetical protein
MNNYQIAQINIARMHGVSINDHIMQEFVDNLDKVNDLAENSEGFIWRLKDENNNATGINPYGDEQILVNVSVWESIEALEKYVYKTFHTDFLRRRKEWFQNFGKVSTAMWWIKKDEFPTIEEAVSKLDYLQQNGASETVFDSKKRFPPPSE